jgi:hypothetical protein
MKQAVLHLKNNITDYIAKGLIFLVSIWVVFALCFQITMVGIHFSGNEQLERDIANWFSWKFDGNFKNSPGNIMYNAEEHIWVESVTNQVKIGKLAGNRNLEFGLKNILEEFLQEKDFELNPESKDKVTIDIIYLDVLKTKSNLSVFHKDAESVVIRLKGILKHDGKKIKEVIVEEESSEISMSTLAIDNGGNFNQQSLSNALKKSSNKLVNKLFEIK